MASITPLGAVGLHSSSSVCLNGGTQLRSSRSSPSPASTPAPSHNISPRVASLPRTASSSRSKSERPSSLPVSSPSLDAPIEARTAFSNRLGNPSSSMTNRSPAASPSMKSMTEVIVGPTDCRTRSPSGYPASESTLALGDHRRPSAGDRFGSVLCSSRALSSSSVEPRLPAATNTRGAVSSPRTSCFCSIRSNSTR